jgi:hypothetical protein
MIQFLGPSAEAMAALGDKVTLAVIYCSHAAITRQMQCALISIWLMKDIVP